MILNKKNQIFIVWICKTLSFRLDGGQKKSQCGPSSGCQWQRYGLPPSSSAPPTSEPGWGRPAGGNGSAPAAAHTAARWSTDACCQTMHWALCKSSITRNQPADHYACVEDIYCFSSNLSYLWWIKGAHSQCDGGLSHRCIGQEVSCNGFHPQNQHNDWRQETHVQQNPVREHRRHPWET